VAAWGLFEKKDVQTLNRVASARTMDGFKIRAKLALNFPKPVSNAEAEDVMMQYARAYASIVECELSNGDLPFEEHELHQRLTDAVQALPKKNVRLIGLHVWHKGAISSRSMLAVKPEGKATVPAMPAVSTSQTREKTGAPASHTATTVKPAASQSAIPDSAPHSGPASVRSAVTVPAPSDAASNRPAPEYVSRPAPTAARAPAQPPISARAMPPTSAASGLTTKPTQVNIPAVNSRAPTQTSMAAATARPGSTASMPASRVVSGVVPAVEPRILRSKSGFLLALEQSTAETGDDVGRAMAQPIRDAAAGLLLATLDAVHASLSDPLALFDGRADPDQRRALIGEACVCVCYVLYESLTRTSLPQMQGIQVVQAACVHALSDKNMPVSEISRYLATENPREEFSVRACQLLGVRETTELSQRVEGALRSLRIDVKTCAEQIETRLSRPRAAGGR
jgi:hypothetical protein